MRRCRSGFGPTISDPIDADVVVAQDPDEGRGDKPTDACSPLTNSAEVAGKWVYVDEANCGFQTPVDHVADAGGAGIIVGNRFKEEGTFSISAEGDIYGVMVTKADGKRFRQAGTATATISPTDDSPRADSYRWLQGEQSPALGGAIRDMWNPTCYGDPGKVSDAEYKCSEDDNGGVHSNSGVVNHAYSLLVDGGESNGVTVSGLGLAKSAHIFWQAQSAHLTSTSDFVDLADALATSCTELTGQPLRKTLDQDARLPVTSTSPSPRPTALRWRRPRAPRWKPGSTRRTSATSLRCCARTRRAPVDPAPARSSCSARTSTAVSVGGASRATWCSARDTASSGGPPTTRPTTAAAPRSRPTRSRAAAWATRTTSRAGTA